EWLCLTASLVFIDILDYEYEASENQKLYAPDIIYTTNGRLGFVYLTAYLADHKRTNFLP
ncbi:hypothetical protein, partial [Staphylococcus warneri]|uniref:hypothetical protein n=1 Tax=Staphylococcus warneri TaxID=1292 RepID=UPI0021AA7C41